jgi:hypothetical protein
MKRVISASHEVAESMNEHTWKPKVSVLPDMLDENVMLKRESVSTQITGLAY